MSSKAGDVHVLPLFGKPHEESSGCWCLPKLDPTTAALRVRLWVHNLAN